ncbi:MAG: alpha/beta hydrolase [Sphingomicrobium sp.]
MKIAASFLAIALALTGCAAAPSATTQGPRYLYYLHGKIIEDLGPAGVSPRFGAYDYPGIIQAFERAGLTVVSEVRPKDTDPSAYADKVVAEVRDRLDGGVPAADITIVGASKGAVIAMLVSSRLRVDGVHYVFLANCNDWMERTFAPRFTGDVLSIYEASDDIGQSCRPIAERSPAIGRFDEIRLETGLGHGVVYRPLPEWVDPATTWATHSAAR